MNLVSLIGRVVKEVEVQQLQPSGKSGLIPSRCKMYTETAMILSFTLYPSGRLGKIAERIGKFVKKGDRIGMEGRLQYASLH